MEINFVNSKKCRIFAPTFGTNKALICAKIKQKIIMYSAHNQIENAIKKRGRGKIFLGNDFSKYGTPFAVRHTLSRLCKKGDIIRLSAGIYLYPKIDNKTGLGVLYPSIEDIAKTIAKKEQARLVPTGAYAQNRLGLSTQVPMKVVFLTDGTPRVIKVGKKATIRFMKTTPRNLAFKGKITQLVCAALKDIGKGKVTDEQLKKIEKALAFESSKIIQHDATLAPEWIAKIMLNSLHNE